MVPVLDIKIFEAHSEKNNGLLEPRENCTATSRWDYLLHALAINPVDGVLTWKPASGRCWDMPEGKLAMDVRGAAFCHLVNLYRMGEQGEENLEVDVVSLLVGSTGVLLMKTTSSRNSNPIPSPSSTLAKSHLNGSAWDLDIWLQARPISGVYVTRR
jgi:hypothetical protein